MPIPNSINPELIEHTESAKTLNSKTPFKREGTSCLFVILAVILVASVGLLIGMALTIPMGSAPYLPIWKVVTPTVAVTKAVEIPYAINTRKVAYLKDNWIYASELTGKDEIEILDLQKEELNKVDKLYMKVSPNGRYIAYSGTSGGVDTAIKVIDIYQKKKIFQEVYGSASIGDFDWSPNSKLIVLGINLKNNTQDFSSALYVADPFAEAPILTPQFTAENIEITQVEWIDSQSIYYSRISYAPEQNIALVKFNPLDKTRTIKIIDGNTSEKINFAVANNNKKIITTNAKAVSLPDLQELPRIANSIPNAVQWQDPYIVGFATTEDSKEYAIQVINTKESTTTYVLNRNPKETIHELKLIKEKAIYMLIVWSEIDSVHNIKAYDLESCKTAQQGISTCKLLWSLANSYSLGY